MRLVGIFLTNTKFAHLGWRSTELGANKAGYKNGIYAPVTYRLLLLLLVDRLFSALFSGEKYSRFSRFLEPPKETQAGRLPARLITDRPTAGSVPRENRR